LIRHLFIAVVLVLALAIAAIALFPGVDLAVARWFWMPADGFWLSRHDWATLLRRVSMWPTIAIGVAALVSVLQHIVAPATRQFMTARAAVFLFLTVTAAPVLLVDPASGKTIRATTPRCPKSADTPWDLATSAGDQVRGVPGGQDVYAVFGFGDTCVARWNPANGAIRWTSRLTGLGSYDEDEIVDSEQDLVLGTNGNVVVAVDLTTGKAKQLEVTGDVVATPSQIVGRTLVALTVTTRGTPKGGLAAWNLASGERRWANASLGTAVPVSRGSNQPSDALFDGTPRSLLVPAGDGLNAFVFEGTDRTFSVSPVDLETGQLGTEVRRGFATRYDSGTVSLTVEGQDGDRLVVSIDNLLQTLPVSGRGDIVTFPEKN